MDHRAVGEVGQGDSRRAAPHPAGAGGGLAERLRHRRELALFGSAPAIVGCARWSFRTLRLVASIVTGRTQLLLLLLSQEAELPLSEDEGLESKEEELPEESEALDEES